MTHGAARPLAAATKLVDLWANLGSASVIVSTIATLAPKPRNEVAPPGMKSWHAGNMASMMTGAVIGLVTWG